MIASEELNAHADRIRASGALGRSELMRRLFDFLVACSLAGKTPKEIELAIEVFGKDARFEATQDALVRVYIYKLRRKLENYYAGPGAKESGQLLVPRGEYRLAYLEAAQSAPLASEPNEPASQSPDDAADQAHLPAPIARRAQWRSIAAIGVAALLAINAVLWFALAHRAPWTEELRAVRASTVWRELASDDKPVTIAVGDYYIFGELGASDDAHPQAVQRLVREFEINSRRELESHVKNHPQFADRYMDVGLRYLPVSTAFALRDVVRLLESGDKSPQQVRVLLASDLTPELIRTTHVVYIGLLSGMSMLRDIAFAGSKFEIGASYDELIDRQTRTPYISQVSAAMQTNSLYRDYGYFATFAGPTGCRIVILAGARDAALMHTANMASRAESLRELAARTHGARDVEALYAVEGMDQINLDGHLIVAAALDSTRIWPREALTLAATAP